MPKKYVQIVTGLPVEGPFTYEVPADLIDAVALGKRAWVPFGRRRLVGYIVGLADKSDIRNIKYIYSVIDDEPILGADILKLTKWMGEYYFCSWGEAIESALPPLLKKGKDSTKTKKQLSEEEYLVTSNLALNSQQVEVLASLKKDIDSHVHNVYLVHGITGSGKTEVYMQAIDALSGSGKSAIVLVPEISLTPQTLERFKSRFQGRVAVLHSRLSAASRFAQWKKIKDGKADIVIGARSAVFAPVGNLGLIVIDEEHETSYKQQDAPRYHAKDVAIKRAQLTGAVVVLGSATPSLESYHKAKEGEFKLLNMTQRIESRQLPAVQVIDMRQHSAGNNIFSRPMQDGIQDTLNKSQQAIIFLNRRGFATFMSCKKCGFVLKCKNCDVTLTYHFKEKKLTCHWCNYKETPPEICPKCKGAYINYFGAGTEKIESEISRLFGGANISRMDTDVTIKRDSHKEILDGFKSGHTHMLIGTQMVAKGHDFPKVTLVAVVSADSALHVPDFRCGERTFCLLTQVAGRAGRGETPGRVLVQTFTPEHYAIVAASKHDYAGFFEQEMRHRKQLKLPPYTHLVKVMFRSAKQDKAVKSAQLLAKRFVDLASPGILEVAGPAMASILRLRREYLWSVIIKADKAETAVSALKKCLKDFKRPAGVRMTVDVDPM